MKEIEKIADQSIRDHEPILGVKITYDEQVIFSKERPRDWTFDYRTSLIPTRFEGTGVKPLRNLANNENILGDLKMSFRSPRDFRPVQKLTDEYRYYLGCILILICLMYWTILRYVILPLRDVTMSIEHFSGGEARFILNPLTRLEVFYNQMARDAQLMELRSGNQKSQKRNLRQTLPELVETLAPNACKWFGFSHFSILDLEQEENDAIRLVLQLPQNTSTTDNFDPRSISALYATDAQVFWQSEQSGVHRYEENNDCREFAP